MEYQLRVASLSFGDFKMNDIKLIDELKLSILSCNSIEDLRSLRPIIKGRIEVLTNKLKRSLRVGDKITIAEESLTSKWVYLANTIATVVKVKRSKVTVKFDEIDGTFSVPLEHINVLKSESELVTN
jgi:hypothetical protein|tara:strand:- start:3197 stop:3577 length:381 start_codon:yes stop_codon:yes gene_type:complete